jgi:hypothetical protein
MDLQWFDFVGFVGVVLVLFAYLALQAGRLSGNGFTYGLLNLLGAAGILVPVLYAERWNWSVIFIEGAWIAISLYGIRQSFKRLVAPRDKPAA